MFTITFDMMVLNGHHDLKRLVLGSFDNLDRIKVLNLVFQDNFHKFSIHINAEHPYVKVNGNY